MEMDHLGRSMKAQLKAANRVGARYALIAGEAERAVAACCCGIWRIPAKQQIPVEEDAAAAIYRLLITFESIDCIDLAIKGGTMDEKNPILR